MPVTRDCYSVATARGRKGGRGGIWTINNIESAPNRYAKYFGIIHVQFLAKNFDAVELDL